MVRPTPGSHSGNYQTCQIVNNINNGNDDNIDDKDYDDSDNSDGDGDSDSSDDNDFYVFDFSVTNLFSRRESRGRLQWATPETISYGVFEEP
jgi:hypothetical protein